MLRVDAKVKDLFTAAADADRRGLSNMLAVIALRYCKQHVMAAAKPLLPGKPRVAAKKKRAPA